MGKQMLSYPYEDVLFAYQDDPEIVLQGDFLDVNKSALYIHLRKDFYQENPRGMNQMELSQAITVGSFWKLSPTTSSLAETRAFR